MIVRTRDQHSRHEQRLRGMHQRFFKSPRVPNETQRYDDGSQKENNHVDDEVDFADGVEAGKAMRC